MKRIEIGLFHLFYALCVVNGSFAWWLISGAVCYNAIVRLWLWLQIVAFCIGR